MYDGTAVAGPFLDDSLPPDAYRLIVDQLSTIDLANLAEVNHASRKFVRQEHHPWHERDIRELDAECGGEANRRRVQRALVGARADEV